MRTPAILLLAVLLCGCGGRSRPAPPDEPETTPTDENPKLKTGLIVLTPAGAVMIKEIIRKGQADGSLPAGKLYMRVRLDKLRFKLDLDPDLRPKDHLEHMNGVDIVLDQTTAIMTPQGTVVDYVNGPGEKGFKITAPPNLVLGVPDTSKTLAEARAGFKTNLTHRNAPGAAPPTPPAEVFQLVKYDSSVGQLHAYMTPDPKDGQKRPAMVWITGGDCNTIDAGCWREGTGGNDQSASAYRKAGLVMMFPSQRGGNDNPGPKEGFLGEVDDIIAAAKYLAKQPHVDPKRIYLGGHSTGGTLVLLVSEQTSLFRAVFSLGPVGNPLGYGSELTPYPEDVPQEVRLRAPELWLHSIRSPTFVLEGTESSNEVELDRMARANTNNQCRFYPVKGANHFNLLESVNRLIAARILADKGPKCTLSLKEEEVNNAFKLHRPRPDAD